MGFVLTETFLKKPKEKIIQIDESPTISELSNEATRIDETPPNDIQALVDYLRDKYMLLNVTLSTTEGLLVASNSPSAEEDAAMAPEILRMASKIVNADRIVVSGENGKILVFKVNPEIVAHIRVTKDLTESEIKRLKEEITRFMEEYL